MAILSNMKYLMTDVVSVGLWLSLTLSGLELRLCTAELEMQVGIKQTGIMEECVAIHGHLKKAHTAILDFSSLFSCSYTDTVLDNKLICS